METVIIEFYCPYCGAWINEDKIHEENHHYNNDELDQITVDRWRYSEDGGKTWTESTPYQP